MEFKQRLRELRKEADLTQEELAKELKYSPSAIANYESGRNTPNLPDLIKLSKIFQVSIEYLVGISDIKNPYRYCHLMTVENDDLQQEQIHQIANNYGFAQFNKTIEELSELTTVISRYIGKCQLQGDVTDLVENMIEEIADVELMTAQLKMLLNCSLQVEAMKKYKIQRTLKGIEQKSNNSKIE